MDNLLQNVLTVVMPVFAGAIVAWAISQWQQAKVKISVSEIEIIRIIVSSAVAAVEQLYHSEQIQGEKRLGEAVKRAQDALVLRGIKVNLPELIMYVEAAVGKELNGL